MIILTQESDLCDGEKKQELLWRSVPKCLMTIGRQGVRESHCHSLQDLLSVHALVKVKVLATSHTETCINTLLRETNAIHLQSKGDTLLFASSKRIHNVHGVPGQGIGQIR